MKLYGFVKTPTEGTNHNYIFNLNLQSHIQTEMVLANLNLRESEAGAVIKFPVSDM